MLIGCCLNLLATDNDPIGIEKTEMIAKTGYDYIELPMARLMELDDKAFNRLCKRVEKANIPCRSCSNLLPAHIKVTGVDADYDMLRAYLKKATQRAKQLGVSVLVFGSPASRNVVGDFPRETAMLQFIKTLQIMDEYADDNLSFVIEHVCKLEGNLVYTVQEGCAVHEICRTKHIGVLADTYHMAIENEPIENIALAGSNLLHVHTANPAGRIYPASGDGVDYKKMMDVLKSINYCGGISVEAFTESPEADAAKALDVLRKAAM